jgi:hypothetical protein
VRCAMQRWMHAPAHSNNGQQQQRTAVFDDNHAGTGRQWNLCGQIRCASCMVFDSNGAGASMENADPVLPAQHDLSHL